MPGSTSTMMMSVGVGFALLTTTILFGYLSNTYGFSGNMLKWVLLPVVGYGITFGFNAGVQAASCGSINPKQLALGSLVVPGAILFFLLLSLMSSVRYPVEQAVPLSYKGKWAGVFAVAFYMFWAGMFGEAFAGGLAQSCGVQASGSPLPK